MIKPLKNFKNSIINRQLKWVGISLVLLLLAGGCEKNPVEVGNQTPEPAVKGAFIVNEGNFGGSNASLSFYNADSSKIFNDIFSTVNGLGLGDVANSMIINDTLGYLVVNNSDRIEVISTRTFRQVGTIRLSPGSSPRHITITGNGQAYVSNLFNNRITVVDLSSYASVDSFAVGANPEEILVHNGRAYVANSGFGNGNTVSVVDVANNAVIAEVTVGDNPQWIRTDADGEIHVLCGGAFNDFSDPTDDTPGGVWVINPASGAVTDSLVLAVGDHPGELAISSSGKGYFLLNNNVIEYSTVSNQIESNPLISGSGNLYHISADDDKGLLYVLDAKDFVASGEFVVYDMSGVEQDRETVGVIPGFVVPAN